MLLSACNQLLSLGALRREMVIRSTGEREGALPYIVGGLMGVPIGLVLLHALPTTLFTAALGIFLVVYSVAMLAKPDSLRLTLSGWKAAVAIGVAGGMLGGVSAMPALISVAYLGRRQQVGNSGHYPALHLDAANSLTRDARRHQYGDLQH
jgi:uncharacterized membrane protein YfcA